MKLWTTCPGVLAERAHQERDLAAFKAQVDADVKLVKTSLLRLERSVAYRESTRAIWKLNIANPKTPKRQKEDWHQACTGLALCQRFVGLPGLWIL